MPTGDGPPAFLPARPITQADLAALTEKVRRRVVRWFRIQRFLDADAAADMLARENSGFSVDASVWITLIDRDVPSYFQSLEHLLRYCARPGVSGVGELSPFEFLDRLADLVPRPRKHRHRYHGVFAPNHMLRSAVTALAIGR